MTDQKRVWFEVTALKLYHVASIFKGLKKLHLLKTYSDIVFVRVVRKISIYDNWPRDIKLKTSWILNKS